MTPTHPLPSLLAAALRRCTPAEAGLLWTALALLVLAVFGPVLPASAHQHGFADARTLWGVPCALDVLSNLPFALAGAWGLALLWRLSGGSLEASTREIGRAHV